MKRLEKRVVDLEQARAAEDVVLQVIYYDELTGEKIEGKRYILKEGSNFREKPVEIPEKTNQD